MFKAVTALKLSGDVTDRHTDTAFYSLGYQDTRTAQYGLRCISKCLHLFYWTFSEWLYAFTYKSVVIA